jgi:serine/threonine-protein kinase
MREARAAVALSSEHVARVLDVGAMPDGAPFVVMEHLEGETLASRLYAVGALSVPETVAIAKQVCAALGEAHRAGIVHRDIKPGNIFLARRDGREVVKVLDFGIAKVTDPHVSVEPAITGTSEVLGTPRYMSPEQLSSTRDVGPPSDVWSLGVTLYECLAGKPALTGSPFEMGARILAADLPRVAAVRPDVPPALSAILETCLKKDPGDRFPNADAVLAALEGRPGAVPASVPTSAAQPLDLPPTQAAPLLAPTRVATAVPSAPQTSNGVVTGLLVVAVVLLLLGGVGGGLLAFKARRPAAVATDPPIASADPAPIVTASAEPQPATSAQGAASREASAPPPSASVVRKAAPARRSSPPPTTAAAPAPRPTAISRPPDER